MFYEEMTTADLLRKGRDLISDPEHWCQGDYAVSRYGTAVETNSPAVYALCAIGALANVLDHPSGWGVPGWCRAPLQTAAEEEGWDAPHILNDRTTHADVMAMYDRAIELAEANQ